MTGAGRGLGAAICRGLAREDVRVIACSRTESALADLVGSLPGRSDHLALTIDLEVEGAIHSLLAELADRAIDIDIVINNVGGTLSVADPLTNYSHFRRVMDLNLGVSVELNANLIPAMQSRSWGRVCHVSSISALENQGPPAYCAAKAALNAYVRSLGRFVSPDNVILTGIMPGAVFTEGGYWDEASIERPDHVRKYLEERMAIKRFGHVEEISEAVLFLVSDLASFLVGSVLLADGGQGRVFYPQGD